MLDLAWLLASIRNTVAPVNLFRTCRLDAHLSWLFQNLLGKQFSPDVEHIRFCAVETIFAALCECASKNPDPDQEDDEGEFFFDEDEVRRQFYRPAAVPGVKDSCSDC